MSNQVYDAVQVLWEHRHSIPNDALRTLQNVYTCASAARFGRPYETGWLEDPETYEDHCVVACENDQLPGECPCHESARAWFERELEFAVAAHEMTGDLERRLDEILPPDWDDFRWSGAATDEQFAQAAQTVACRRETCSHDRSDPKHLRFGGQPPAPFVADDPYDDIKQLLAEYGLDPRTTTVGQVRAFLAERRAHHRAQPDASDSTHITDDPEGP